jgi:3-hydroxymyristoyl/3-hydroxydecanoyl-(acyl carrier protein) dehydratase
MARLNYGGGVDYVLMDTKEILTILPHRYPMLLVDQVVECDFKERVVASRT